MKARIGCLVVLTVAVNAASAAAATITVTTTGDPATPSGQCSLREAIAAVNTPGSLQDGCAMADDQSNTIVLGPHEYDLTIHPTGADDQTTGDLDATGTTPLTIQGAGVGVTSISGAAPPGQNPGAALQDRILHVLAGATVTIKDLTITGGHAPNGANGVSGASFPMVTAPTAGMPGSPGGAIRNEGTLALQGVAVTNNTAGSGGLGGSGEPDTSGSDANGQKGGGGGAGGGIYNDSPGSLTLTDATVSGNVAGDGGLGGAGGVGATQPIGPSGGDGGCCGDGGGLDNVGGHVIITGSTFSGNHAGGGGSGGAGQEPMSGFGGAGGQGQGGSSGGAIATSGATATVSVTNSTLAGNFSGAGGNGGKGGDANETPNINWPSGGGAGNGSAGGGLFANGAAVVTLTNVTVAENNVGGPGAPGAVGSGPSCTGPNCGHPLPGAAGNPAFGGGVYDSTTPAATLTNTLLASNELGNCAVAGHITDGGHNLSFGASTGCPSTFTHGDPKLTPLQDNGGPTQTEALQTGSAAIDQVPATGANCPMTDQRGVSRPSGAACDIGAYEVTPPSIGLPTATAITTASATLGATVTANDATAAVEFQFGTTTAYGSTANGTSVAGLTSEPTTATVTGLKPGTTYHFRVVANTSDGTASTADQTFTTAKAPIPVLTHLRIKPNKVGKRGATITYRDTQAATTSFKILRGHKTVASFSHKDKVGANKLHFKRGKLRRGTYTIKATPRLHGITGSTVAVKLRVT